MNTSHEPEIHSAWHTIFVDYFIKRSKNIDNLHFISATGVKWDDYLYSDRKETKSSHPKQISILKIDADSIRSLIEYKSQKEYNSGNLQDRQNRSRVVAQIIHYMKEIQKNGQYREPNVLVGADDREGFVLPSKYFLRYLNKNYDWSISPRQAFDEIDPNLIKDLNNDGNLNIFPFRFDFGNFRDKYQNLLDMLISIENIGNNSKSFQKMPVNAHTFTTAYQQFKLIAFPAHEKISSVESVNIFMQQLTNRNSPNYFVNPNNKGYFFANGRNIRVNGARINTFMSRYPRNISPKLSRHLRGIADRLIQIEERRRKGDFWTPSIWGDKANDVIHQVVDNHNQQHDFRNYALVWDMAAGVKNLTRDNKYKDLYISKIHQAELELGSDYNPEAKKNVFQYDYLHDDMDKTPHR